MPVVGSWTAARTFLDRLAQKLCGCLRLNDKRPASECSASRMASASPFGEPPPPRRGLLAGGANGGSAYCHSGESSGARSLVHDLRNDLGDWLRPHRADERKLRFCAFVLGNEDGRLEGLQR